MLIVASRTPALATSVAGSVIRTGIWQPTNIHSLGGGPSRYYHHHHHHSTSPSASQPPRLLRGYATAAATHTHHIPQADKTPRSPQSPQPPSSVSAAPATIEQSLAQTPELEIERVKHSYVMDHHIYEKDHLDGVAVLHHQPKGLSDRLAWALVKTMRTIFDVATRYPSSNTRFPPIAKERQGTVVESKQEGEKAMPLKDLREKGLAFGPDQWLTRFIFLESVAGVPGMVAGTARHLHSLRLLRRDRGWIATCLEDAENERMHLLTFLAIRQPGAVMRALLLGTQGLFYNFLFLFYLAMPKTVHRFVGILEEEAVYTYSRVIEDIEAGRLPEWEEFPAPEIAVDYWKLGHDAKMLDLLKVIRADEAGHRFIHHTLANLDQREDTNPFSIATPSPAMIGRKLNLSREESLRFIEQARKQGETEQVEMGRPAGLKKK